MGADADALATRLRAALDGGPPVVLGDPPTAPVPDGVAVVLRTSGSTSGTGRAVALTARALLASADATHDRLGGPGRWVLALPPHHVAGVQVLVRAARSGLAAAVLDGPFDPRALAVLLARAAGPEPLYLSLVPTQLHRVVAGGGEPLAALRRCAAVLLGGAAAPPSLLAAAGRAGVRVVVTYGMSETSGGCVYDGVPLDGVDVALDDGRVLLAGPVLAEGYLDDGPQPFEQRDGRRWFRTSDLGTLDAHGRLTVLGRADDVLVTGGTNVHPAAVERLLEPLAGPVLVVGVPDPEWGQLVTAVVTGPATLPQLREAAGGGPTAPRALVRIPALPERGPGKPDRRAAAALARDLLARGEGERH